MVINKSIQVNVWYKQVWYKVWYKQVNIYGMNSLYAGNIPIRFISNSNKSLSTDENNYPIQLGTFTTCNKI